MKLVLEFNPIDIVVGDLEESGIGIEVDLHRGEDAESEVFGRG